MDLKPFNKNKGQDLNNDQNQYNQEPNNFSTTDTGVMKLERQTNFQTQSFISTQNTKDPKGIIPNGIYKVFKSQKNTKVFSIIVSTLMLISFFILIALYIWKPTVFKVEKTPIVWYILTAIAILVVSWKFIGDIIELKGLLGSVKEYRNALMRNEKTLPPFVSLLYRKILLRQVAHNWITIAFVFYFGLFTLIFWALKDQQWMPIKGAVFKGTNAQVYAFDWKQWFLNSFPNPMLFVWICVAILAVVSIVHIVFAIIRKNKIVSIESFMGSGQINFTQIQEEKSKLNRFYAKIFFISILILLVLPIIIYIFAKKIIWKKRG